MKISRSTKYAIAWIGMVIMFGLCIAYYLEVQKQPRDGSKATELYAIGAVLFVAVSANSVALVYYRKDRDNLVEQSERASELNALALTSSHKLKPAALDLEVTAKELQTISSTGTLQVRPERFDVPIRRGDTVRLHAGKSGPSGTMPATIETIDGYDQVVVLRLETQAREA